jgi:hypothetical protein
LSGSITTSNTSLIGDAFVARFKPDLSGLIFSTYLGGTGGDEVCSNDGLFVDSNGIAYLLGNTDSNDFPMAGNGYRQTRYTPIGNLVGQGRDSFVAKLSADGKTLLA